MGIAREGGEGGLTHACIWCPFDVDVDHLAYLEGGLRVSGDAHLKVFIRIQMPSLPRYSDGIKMFLQERCKKDHSICLFAEILPPPHIARYFDEDVLHHLK